MLEQNLLDNFDKTKVRTPYHKALETILLLGHAFIFLYCLHEISLMGFLSTDAVEEFIFILLNSLGVGYIYAWHHFSIAYDNNKTSNTAVPVFLNPLRLLSFFASLFFCFIAFLFLNFEAYQFNILLETAQLMTLFFAILGLLQFLYTLLTPNKLKKRNLKNFNKL